MEEERLLLKNLEYQKEHFTEKLNSMIWNYKRHILQVIAILLIYGCGNYSFTGASIPEGTESFQVNLIKNWHHLFTDSLCNRI